MTDEQEIPEIVENVTEELPTQQEEKTELENHLKRLQAEFENYKKRVVREKEEIAQRGNASFMIKLLELVDELELALVHIKGKKDEHTKGIEMFYANLISLLKNEGIEEMKNVEKFDPYKHEAIRHEDSNKPEGTITSVLKKGYYYKGVVLRHAMVSVSKGIVSSAIANKATGDKK
ncbi:MAG: nucleotide exchange factor GrpE [Candidatus Micrarchaeota archaeon]|nr:nucleotide exchange factor GrpE [Candidatus Micrarchaeota archaeon]